MMDLKGQFDGKFQAFQMLADFTERLLMRRQLSAREGALIHEYADKIAKELLNGMYVYTPKINNTKEKEGNR